MCADHCIWSSISKCKHKRNNSSYVVSQIMYGPYISFVSFFQCKQKEINWFWEIVVHQEFMQLEIIVNMITILCHLSVWLYLNIIQYLISNNDKLITYLFFINSFCILSFKKELWCTTKTRLRTLNIEW